jgi:hypothetical protein
MITSISKSYSNQNLNNFLILMFSNDENTTNKYISYRKEKNKIKNPDKK